MDKIKIGRIEYEIKKGDYVMYNGACFQFCAGDGRMLKYKNGIKLYSLVMPRAAVKSINFYALKKIDYQTGSGANCSQWNF